MVRNYAVLLHFGVLFKRMTSYIKRMTSYIRAKFRKVTKKRNLAPVSMMLECNLKLFDRVVLLVNGSKSTRT